MRCEWYTILSLPLVDPRTEQKSCSVGSGVAPRALLPILYSSQKYIGVARKKCQMELLGAEMLLQCVLELAFGFWGARNLTLLRKARHSAQGKDPVQTSIYAPAFSRIFIGIMPNFHISKSREHFRVSFFRFFREIVYPHIEERNMFAHRIRLRSSAEDITRS